MYVRRMALWGVVLECLNLVEFGRGRGGGRRVRREDIHMYARVCRKMVELGFQGSIGRARREGIGNRVWSDEF